MLKPRKHMNLDVSVLRISALMLRALARRRVIDVETLRRKIERSVGADAEFTFASALHFLFIVGKIRYHVKNDMLELVEAE